MHLCSRLSHGFWASKFGSSCLHSKCFTHEAAISSGSLHSFQNKGMEEVPGLSAYPCFCPVACLALPESGLGFPFFRATFSLSETVHWRELEEDDCFHPCRFEANVSFHILLQMSLALWLCTCPFLLALGNRKLSLPPGIFFWPHSLSRFFSNNSFTCPWTLVWCD